MVLLQNVVDQRTCYKRSASATSAEKIQNQCGLLLTNSFLRGSKLPQCQCKKTYYSTICDWCDGSHDKTTHEG